MGSRGFIWLATLTTGSGFRIAYGLGRRLRHGFWEVRSRGGISCAFRPNRLLRSCEEIGWQAKAPAPRACKSFGSKVGQTLSSVNPGVSAISLQLLRERFL